MRILGTKFGKMLKQYRSLIVQKQFNFTYISNRGDAFNNSFSPFCLKCKIVIVTLTQCLWSCRLIQNYWINKLHEMQKILSIDLELDSFSLLLGLPDHLTSVAITRPFNIMTFCRNPSVKGWHTVLMELIPLE